MNRFIVFLILLVLFLPNGFSQRLKNAIDDFANDPVIKYGSASVSVVDVETGRLVAGHQPNLGTTPASSLKVVTTAAALHYLGNDFQFKTTLQYSGKIDTSGTLKGNLYIKGFGDPTLGSHQFDKAEKLDQVMEKFVTEIQKAGIKKVEGHIVGDASYLDTEVGGRKWLWEDMGNYYGAGAYGLNIQENLYFIDFQQVNQLGATPPIAAIRPTIPNLMLLNELTADKKGTGDNAYVFGSPYSYTRFIRGTIPVGNETFTIKGSIPDPPFFMAHYLMHYLEKKGVATSKRAVSQFELNRTGLAENNQRTTFYTYSSPSLKEIVKITNLKSINLYCEAMLRTIGKEVHGVGTPEAGLKAIYDYLESRKMETTGFFMLDGSGLSPMNSVSSFHLASAIRIFLKDPKINESFKNSLPIAGQSGTAKYLLRNTAAVGKLRAKSGGMERVRSYTGYVRNKSGQLVAFSIIANNFTCKSAVMRKKMEKVMLAIYNE